MVFYVASNHFQSWIDMKVVDSLHGEICRTLKLEFDCTHASTNKYHHKEVHCFNT